MTATRGSRRPDTAGSPRSHLAERFAQEYALDLNATEAYLRVRPKVRRTTAATNAWWLLRNAEVQARVAELQAELHRGLSERNRVTAEWIEDRLVENVEWSMQAKPVVDGAGKSIGVYEYRGAVANKALETLARMRGLLSDKHQHSGEVVYLWRYVDEGPNAPLNGSTSRSGSRSGRPDRSVSA